jgi:hypothetical protein
MYVVFGRRHKSVGAGLLAIAVVNVTPSSLASQLLQVCGCMWFLEDDTNL